MTSPPATVASACQVARLIVFLMNWTCPSAKRELTPPECHASCRNIERQQAPEGGGAVAVRQAAPAIGEWIIGPPPVVVHAVSRRPVMPPHSAGVLKLRGRRRQAQAQRDIVCVRSECRTGGRVVSGDEENEQRIGWRTSRRESTGSSRSRRPCSTCHRRRSRGCCVNSRRRVR